MLQQDLRYGFRLLARRPGFSLMAGLTLALGIGANTAIFATVDRVLLRAAPFPDSNRLVIAWETNPRLPVPVMVASPPTLHEWQTRSRSFSDIGGFRWRNVTLGGSEPEQVRAATVSAALLRALGVQPRVGRLFDDEDDRANARPVVLLGDGLWRRRFNAEPAVLQQSLIIDGIRHDVVGVMPPGYAAPPPIVFRGQPPVDRAELWLPLATDLPAQQRSAHNLTVVGRLNPGVTIEAADADLKTLALAVGEEHPDYREWSARVVPLTAWITESSRRSMLLLGLGVGFVLLLACANVANLLVSRGIGRRREFAVRSALGAGRRQLGLQAFAESLVLALVGGAAGIALAMLFVRLIVTLGPTNIPGLRETTIEPTALAFAAALSVAVALVAGIAPAVSAARATTTESLTTRTGGRTRGHARLQQALVVSQVALAVTLLVTAVLLVDSFRQLRAMDPGFRPDHVVTGRVSMPAARYPDAQSRAAFVSALLTRARAVPGVSAVGLSDALPMADGRQGTSFEPVGEMPVDPSRPATVNVAFVTDGFFEALGMRLTRGRTLTERDNGEAKRVVVINDTLARQLFGDRDPIGRLARIGMSRQSPFEIVGTVADDRHLGIDTAPTASFFVSFRQLPNMRDLALVARTDADAIASVGALRRAVREVDAELPFFQVRTMEQVVEQSAATPRSLAWLLSTFALVGLTLAAIGLFGVLSHAVGERTAEIGVRMAVGASPWQVLRMVLGQGLLQVMVGLLLGVGLAAATSGLLRGLLFGVTGTSPVPYLIVAVVLVTVGVAAALAPACRAMAIDPVMALKAE